MVCPLFDRELHLQGRNGASIMRKFIEKGSQIGEPHTTLERILPIQ
jgi:hypothetical protein